MLEDIIAEVERSPVMKPGDTAPNHPLESLIARTEGRVPMSPVNPPAEKPSPDVSSESQPVIGERSSVLREFGKGAISGWQGANKAVNDLLEYTGTLTGNETLKDIGRTGSEYWGEKLKANAPRLQKFTDVKNISDFADWAAWNIGQMGSQIAVTAPFMALGRAKAAADATIGAGQVLKGLFTEGGLKQAGKFLAKWAKPRAMDIPIGILEAGQVAEGQLERLKKGETEDLDPIRGLAAAFVATKLEELGAENMVNRLFAKGTTGVKGQLFRKIGQQALATGFGEGAEEFFQTYAEQAGIDPSKLATKETFMEAVNGAAAGAIGGAAIGAGGGAYSHYSENRAIEKIKGIRPDDVSTDRLPELYQRTMELAESRPEDKELAAIRDSFASEIEKRKGNTSDAREELLKDEPAGERSKMTAKDVLNAPPEKSGGLPVNIPGVDTPAGPGIDVETEEDLTPDVMAKLDQVIAGTPDRRPMEPSGPVTEVPPINKPNEEPTGHKPNEEPDDDADGDITGPPKGGPEPPPPALPPSPEEKPEQNPESTGQIEFDENTTPSDMDRIWGELAAKSEEIAERNQPRIDALKKELESLKGNRSKEANARNKAIREEMDALKSEAEEARISAENAILEAEEKFFVRIMSRLEEEGITNADEDDVRELISAFSDGRTDNGRGWNKPLMQQVIDEIKAGRYQEEENETTQVSSDTKKTPPRSNMEVAPETSVFSRMPDDILKQQADYGVQGAKDELARRQAAKSKPENKGELEKKIQNQQSPTGAGDIQQGKTAEITENQKSPTESIPTPAVGATATWTTGVGNTVTGTVTKLDDNGLATIKAEDGRIYVLNPAKARDFTVTEKEEKGGAVPDLRIAGTGGKRGPREEGIPAVNKEQAKKETEKSVSENERKAIELGNNPKKVLQRLKETIATMNDTTLSDWTYDAENKRMIHKDGKQTLQWQTRIFPDRPESYTNQQTTTGTVVLKTINTGESPEIKAAGTGGKRGPDNKEEKNATERGKKSDGDQPEHSGTGEVGETAETGGGNRPGQSGEGKVKTEEKEGKKEVSNEEEVAEEPPARKGLTIDDEIRNTSMEDIEALIDDVIAEQEEKSRTVQASSIPDYRDDTAVRKYLEQNPPKVWNAPKDQVDDPFREIDQVSKLLGRELTGGERFVIRQRQNKNHRFIMDIGTHNEGQGIDFLDMVRNSTTSFAKNIREAAAEELVLRYGIIRTEPAKVNPVKEIKGMTEKYVALINGFAGTDETRKSIMGFYNDNGTLVATDAHKMAVVPDSGTDLESGKIYRLKKDGGLEVIDETFPDYKRIIPDASDVREVGSINREKAAYLLALINETRKRNRVGRKDAKSSVLNLFPVNLDGVSVDGTLLSPCLQFALTMGADRIAIKQKQDTMPGNSLLVFEATREGKEVCKMLMMPLSENLEGAMLEITKADLTETQKEVPTPKAAAGDRKAERPTRSLDSILSDAAREGFGGAAEAIKGLYELFGGSSLKSFPGGFDADTYAKAKPHFKAALEHMRNAGKSLKDFVSFFVEKLGTGVKPYLSRYLQDLKGIEPTKEESTSDVETKKEDGDKPINLDENTGRGERGRRKKLAEQEKAERKAKKKKAALGNFQNVGYVYDPEKIDKTIQDKPPKSAAKILLDEMAPAKVWNIQFPEGATPGSVRLLAHIQKYYVSFKEYLIDGKGKLAPYSYRKNAEETVNYWMEKNGGTIAKLKEWAEEYGNSIQPVIDAFQGQSNITSIIERLQSELLKDVPRKEDGSFPDIYDAIPLLKHPSMNRELFYTSKRGAVYQRAFYEFLTVNWQKLIDAENDILLSEIDAHKRTRNKTVVRIGLPDYRKGVELKKTEDFQKPFGFSGVGFGEQGWINQEERHRVVNAAFDAFQDLAATIGAPEKGMSIGGKLAIQFANLGHKAKGAAAAYFPTIRTINFTRDHGDGTMAHEWGHALHDLAESDIVREINSIINTLKFIYDFEAGERLVNDLLAKDSLFLKRMVSSKKQHRIEAVKDRVRTDFSAVVRKKTDYYRTAEKMDADYTAREQEMWARAWETYIYDTLAGKNNYLVNDFVAAGRVGGKSNVGTHLVYPAGVERETFNEMIRHFVEGLEWDENGVPHLKEGYEAVNERNEKLLEEKLQELLDSVEERYKAIWTSEPSSDGLFWYQYNETGFGPMMQPDGYVAFDKTFQAEGQNGTGAVAYLTQLHPDDILDYKLTNIQYEGGNATYISAGKGGIHDTVQEDGTEALDDELPEGERKAEETGVIRTDERGNGGSGEEGVRHASKERGESERGDGDSDEGIYHAAPGNYRITDPTLTDPKSVAERFNKNLAAIRVLKLVESENRSASPNEKEILAGYTGWGGMSELFSWDPSEAWAGRAELLKAELDDEELRGAESSSTSSYYTPVPIGEFMWKLAQRLGFEGGAVLDPATGASGLFFGTMPSELQQNVALQGIEMDGLSARIASKLYELASIEHKSFQEAKKPRNRYDLTITNVPFENVTPSDPRHNKGGYLLHNYYINKMLDLTAPGTLSIMITTSNTLDSVGDHLTEYAKKADLVGAIRLPSGIYSATNIVTDILVFRKKIEGGKFKGIPVEEWTTAGKDESTGLTINNYFLNHPEMVAGKLEVVRGRWGDDKLRVVDEGDLQMNLERLAAAFPGKIVEREAVREVKSLDDIISAPGTVKEGGLYINDKDEVCLKVEGEEEKLPTATAGAKKNAEIARGFIKILDQVRTVLRAQKSGADEAEIKAAQKQLREEYDAFVKKYGPVNSPDNLKVYGDTTDCDWVIALEDYNPDTKKVTRLADIFTMNIVPQEKKPERAETDHDALAMSLNEFGYPNLEYMAKLRGSDVESIMKGLADKIIEDPETGFLVTMDEYLSGNVKRKLAVAREMAESNPEYERNVKLLEAAQPEDIPANRITARIGAPWVHPEHLADYVRDKLNLYDLTLRAVFNFSPISHEWSLSFRGRPDWRRHGEENRAETERQIRRVRESVEARRIWGTQRKDFIELIKYALAGSRPEVTYRGADGRLHLDEVATQEAENKLQEIQADFGVWLFKDPIRADEAVRRFNDLVNTSVPPKADGSHLTFPGKSMAVLTRKEKEELGMKDAVTFYPHQQNAVWKYLRGGNLYLAHEVGAGKTMTMALIGMEAKRLLGKKKVLYVTLNDSTMGQAIAEIKKLYPLANVLPVRVSTDEQRKQRALHKLAMNDFDIAIMRQQDLDRIALSPEAEAVFNEEELQEYREMLEEARKNGARILEQQIQTAIHVLEEKLRAPGVHDEAKRRNLYFDDLGIDLMIVDEAHHYKNVRYATKLHRITGLNPAGSPTAQDFFRKCQYLNAQCPRQDGIVLASGTALSNSIAEFYNIQRMLHPREMKRQGLWSFDRWIASFGDMGSQLEWDGAKGEYKNITTNRRIVNAGRLLAMAYQNIDCVRAKDTPIRRPKIRGGEPQRIKIKPNRYVEDYKRIVLERCRAIEQDPRTAVFEGVPDNMLRIISNMSKIAIDQRLDPRYADTELQEDSKIYQASRLIRKRWEEEAEHKGVQLVFADIGIPKRYLNFKYKTDEELEKLTDEQREAYHQKRIQYENAASQFSTYDGLKEELIKLGIPAEQIAFIHDADDTNKERKAAKLRQLFKKVNDGEIRVLIGSTDKAGTGVNIQRRVSDVHHLDVWWNYSAWEQRNGRAVRAGNIYTDMEGVYIWNYVTETTVDATRWDKIFAKGKILNAVLGGDINIDILEDISEETMSAKMTAAEASGNPLMARQATLLQLVQSLRFQLASYLDNVRSARNELASIPDRIAAQEHYIENSQKSRAIMEKVTAVRFAGDDRVLTFEKHGKEIAEALQKAVARDATAWDAEKKVPLLVFGSHTVTEKTEEVDGKTKKTKEYHFTPMTARAEITGAVTDPYKRRIFLSGAIMSSERHLADIKVVKGKPPEIDIKANISRTVTEYLSRLNAYEEDAKNTIKDLKEDEPKLRNIVDTPWPKADELAEKTEELARVEAEMAAQGNYVGNPETGIEIGKFKAPVPVLEDIADKSAWKFSNGATYPDGEEPQIAVSKNDANLNSFSLTRTAFKPEVDWRAPEWIRQLLSNSVKPESKAMTAVAFTTVNNVSRFWMSDKFTLWGNEVALTVDPTAWLFLERVLGKQGTWHPETYRDKVFLIHVNPDGQRDAMIQAKAEQEIPDGVAAFMGTSEAPQYSRRGRQNATGKRRPVVTPEQDAAYLKAVEAGDMMTAWKMVNDAAKKAGYTVGPLYHGSPDFRGTTFDRARQGSNTGLSRRGFSFTDSWETAEAYAEPLGSEETAITEMTVAFNKVAAKLTEAFQKDSKLGEAYERELYGDREEASELVAGNVDEIDDVIETAREHAEFARNHGLDDIAAEYEAVADMVVTEPSPQVLRVFLKNPRIEKDRNGRKVWLADSSEQIKLADPVTYDDNGNVIPLSQRFNEESPDIRYRRTVPSRGLAVSKVQSVVDKVTSFLEAAPKINVRQHISECPVAVLEDMEKNGILDENGDADVQGFSWDGQVWIISDNIQSSQEAVYVLMHELTHNGLGAFLKRHRDASPMLESIRTDYNALMDAIYQAHKKEVREIARTTHTHLDLSTPSGRRQAAEEWLCNQAYEAQPKWYDRLVAIFNDILRAMGFNVKLSDAEVRTILQDAFRSFGGDEGAARYMVSAWHGGRNLEDGRFSLKHSRHDEGRGQFGYGLYFSSLDEIGRRYAEEEAERSGSSERHLYHVTLHKGKTPDQYDWLDWYQPLSDKLIRKFQKATDGDYRFNELNDLLNQYRGRFAGGNLYRQVSSILGGDREASAFLLEAGIDGVRYPADALYGTETGATNYVVFDENAVTVEEHIRYSIGQRLREAEIPTDNALPKVLDIKGTNEKILNRAAREFMSWPKTVIAADGSEILLKNPEGGSLADRAKHLIWDNGKNILNIGKAKWLPNVQDTLKNAAVRLVDRRKGNRIYVRAYQDGTKHMVVVNPRGTVIEQGSFKGGLITQFPYIGHGRQDSMRIDWERNKGEGRFQGNPNPTPPVSTVPGPRQKEFHNVNLQKDSKDVNEKPKFTRKGRKGEIKTESLFPEVEERIRQAKGIKHGSIKDRAKDLLGLAWTEMTRHFPHLDPKTQGKTIEVLRQFQEVPVWAKQKATDKLDEFIGKLSPDDRHVFGMNLILADMLRDLDSGLLEPHPEEGLPFGYRDRNQVQQDYDHFSEIADQRPEIRKALEKRNSYMREINDQMIELRILPKNLVNDPSAYFHHQVLAYLNYQADKKGLGVSARDVKKHRKGWQFSRQGSVKDYNTEYIEAEFEVLSQALAQIETVETINELNRLENIKQDLEDEARHENMKAFWSHFAPLFDEDPLKPYRTKMAIGFSWLEKLTTRGEIYYPDEFEELRDYIMEIAENKKDMDEGENLIFSPHPMMFPFLSYLVNHGGPGAGPAATILKAVGEKRRFIKETVGEKNWKTWRDFIPEGYVTYKPDAHPAFYFANSIQDQVLEQVLAGNRNLQDRDVRAVLAKARDAEWVVPEGVAKTLKEFRPATENSLVGKLSEDTLSMWKQWTLMNPFRVFRYNLNNMSGDLDIVMAYDPKIITQYMMQAFRDLKAARKGLEPGKLKDELDRATRKGVIGSGMTQWDIPELSDVRSVKELVDFFDGKTGNIVTRAWNISKSLSTLRENILRLAAYRYFRDQMKAGKKRLYGASNPDEIDQITDRDDRAAKLARELIGDYGNISHAGQWFRKRLIPFYSWIEINAPRYVRLLRNVKHEGGGAGGYGKFTAAMGAKLTWKTAKLGVKALTLMGLVMLWNAAFFPDEEDELQEMGRDQLHLILGRREDGSIRTIRFQGALSDALSWFGLDNPLETARLYTSGRQSAGDIAKQAVKAPATKLFHGLRPEPKLLYEVASGQSFYPNPWKPLPIRDTMGHILKTFSLDKPYHLASGKPKPHGSIYEQLVKDIGSMLFNYSDPGEQAYYTARKYVFDWLEKNGRERQPVMPTNRSNALYYYRQALKFGDFEAAERYLKKYKELGGKESNVRGAIKRAAPLASLKLSDRYKFKQSLSPEQQETLKVATEWYKKHYVGARREDIARRMAAAH